MPAPAFELVSDASRLDALAAHLAGVEEIAVDTEFVRRTTFFARPGLLQISDGHSEWLVDLVALPDVSALRAVFTAPRPLKVMHSCSEDLEVLKRLFGAVPGSLVDTQVAAAMLGHPLQTSYQKILKAVLEVDVPKDETQSDWTARPLTDSQLAYAALDVHHLLPLWRRLAEQLIARGRLAWVQEDCARLLSDASREDAPENFYRSIGNAWRLRPESLGLLSALAAWRERAARQLDKPRSHVVPDNVLWLIAQRRPSTLQQLRAIPDLHPISLRKHGDALLRIVRETPSDLSMPALPPPLPRAAKGVLGALRDMAGAAAKEQGVEVEVLVRRRHLEAIVESIRAGGPSLPVALSGWRRDVIGQRLLDAARSREEEIRGWSLEMADER